MRWWYRLKKKHKSKHIKLYNRPATLRCTFLRMFDSCKCIFCQNIACRHSWTTPRNETTHRHLQGIWHQSYFRLSWLEGRVLSNAKHSTLNWHKVVCDRYFPYFTKMLYVAGRGVDCCQWYMTEVIHKLLAGVIPFGQKSMTACTVWLLCNWKHTNAPDASAAFKNLPTVLFSIMYKKNKGGKMFIWIPVKMVLCH